ncbi:unnamed protein product [Echinostoma caproni]|uniref:Protein kinase domain-containing protein n=1 Tax=Echinostoma caproni TaxID=27848 RepID=A0A183BAN5_9TREM|nr:unnamed protein product [Echinostoma caproni]
MTELDFLSPEVENETDVVGEDFEPPDRETSVPPTRKYDGICSNPIPNYGLGYANGEGKETVEICQKTVNPHNRVSSENFNIQRVIGKGGYGKVFLVQKVDGADKGKLYAMKVLKKARLHPFLVRLHYAFQNHSNLYIVLEYCPGGELFNYLEREGALLENAAWAPEIIKYEGHGKAVDWWSLGTLLFDMLSGGILTAPLKFPPSFSPEVTSLIKGLLKRDPKERLGSKEDVEEIKRHRFFRRHEINWSDVLNRRLKPPFKPHLLADNDTSMFDPSFTRLQPVVSPPDGGRSIPTDMFQKAAVVSC